MAIVQCCVPGCSSRKVDKDPSALSFHGIPVKTNLRELWLKRLRERSLLTKKPLKLADASVVCSLHFIQSDFKTHTKRRILLPTAAPNVFPYVPPVFDDEDDSPPKRRKCTKPKSSETSNSTTEEPVVPAASSSSICTSLQTKIIIDQSENLTEELSCNGNSRSVGVQVSSLRTGHLDELKTENNRLRTKNYRLHEHLKNLKTKVETSEHKIKKLNNFLKIKSIKETDKSTKAKILIDEVNNFEKQNPHWNLETLQQCYKWRTAYRKSYDYARKSDLCTLPSRSTLARFCKEKEDVLFKKPNTLHTIIIKESPITTEVGTFITVQNVVGDVKTKNINIPSCRIMPSDNQVNVAIVIDDIPKSPSPSKECLVVLPQTNSSVTETTDFPVARSSRQKGNSEAS